MISDYIMPVLIIVLLLFAFFKKINTYDVFVKGAKESFSLIKSIFPCILAILVAVNLMRVSGAMSFFCDITAPIFNLLGIPTEVLELVIVRPFTGSGSFAILSDIFATYGADSYISRSACVIMGSSETVFYVASVYFSQTKVKKLLYAIPCALIASLISAILSCLICRIL